MEFFSQLLHAIHGELGGASRDGAGGEALVVAEDGWMEAGKKKPIEVSQRSFVDTPISRVFGGMMRSSDTRGRGVASYEPFFDLQLSVQGVSSVLDALNKYFESDGSRCVRIERAPSVLVISLKRYAFTTGLVVKLTNLVAVPVDLVVSVKNFVERAGQKDVAYRLHGMALHVGAAASWGHYTATVNVNGAWYSFDDAYVARTSIDEKRPRGTEYILVYRRLEKNSH